MGNIILFYQIVIVILLVVGFLMGLSLRNYYRELGIMIQVIEGIDKERIRLQEKYEGGSSAVVFNKYDVNENEGEDYVGK
jgi:hypothetical protein